MTHIPLEGRMIPLSIRRHRRARRISLRLSPARDGIVMTLPVRASVASGMAFFTSKAHWVLTHVAEDAGVPFSEGTVLPVLGNEYVIRCMAGRGVAELVQGEFRVFCKPEFTARRVRDFVKKTLREACLSSAQGKAARLGKQVKDVKIRDTRSRWGSCSTGGVLTFHWQLVFAPPPVLEYLVAHEVAHLEEMNHSQRFWQVVARLCPHVEPSRRWLKANGHLLHRFGR